jgi:hypothetical protein
MNNLDFIRYIRATNGVFFIEAEARRDKMINFINRYLGEVDKWGVELRIYLNDITNMPQYWLGRKYSNKKYRANEFSYRVDDNDLVNELFDNGYRIGYNNP